MDLTPIIGFVAGCGTTFAALPDLIAMLKRRSSVNPRMAGIMGTFQILWVLYGRSIGSGNLVIWNAIGVCTNLLTVGAYVYVRRRSNALRSRLGVQPAGSHGAKAEVAVISDTRPPGTPG
jgi:uncharacterized protein with PQ loop repeat